MRSLVEQLGTFFPIVAGGILSGGCSALMMGNSAIKPLIISNIAIVQLDISVPRLVMRLHPHRVQAHLDVLMAVA